MSNYTLDIFLENEGMVLTFQRCFGTKSGKGAGTTHWLFVLDSGIFII
jgi:hypothetical protein